MGISKKKQIEETNYCYFCQKEILPDEPRVRLGISTQFEGGKKVLVSHPLHMDCSREGDQRGAEG